MKKIYIEKENVGNCTIKSEKNIPVANEFAIKSLAFMQMLLIEHDARTNQDIKEVIRIITRYSQEISDIYRSNNATK